VDADAFKAELVDGFRTMGLGEAVLSKLQISLREGSVIATVRGPASTMKKVLSKPVADVKVMGYGAKLLKTAEKATCPYIRIRLCLRIRVNIRIFIHTHLVSTSASAAVQKAF